MLKCVTSQNIANENTLTIEVNFGGRKKHIQELYTYVSDPIISRVEPLTTFIR